MSIPNFSIKTLPTILEFEVSKLIEKTGLRTTTKLLDAACSPKRREFLSKKVDISEERLLELANYCSLMRIKHLGPIYVKLLRACGVHTVPELAMRNVTRLAKIMKEKNKELKIAPDYSLEKKVEAWKIQAMQQPKTITYVSYK